MLYQFENVSLDYLINKRSIRILSDFNLMVETGEFLALMGPSGSGKTSILNMMAGFLRPISGRIQYVDSDLYRLDSKTIADYRNREIGMVHQFFNLIPDFTAIQNVMAPLLISGERTKTARDTAEAMLEKVGMLSRAAHYPSELSGGEQQRIAIARALIKEPKVILADEPTGNLDYATSREIMALFANIHKTGTSIVVVTHDPSFTDHVSRVIDLATIVRNKACPVSSVQIKFQGS